MNKQELIERIKCLKNIFGNKTKYVEKDTVIKLISELDEPQKVKIPQFVADLLEFAKLNDWDLEDVFEDVRDEYSDTEISKWFYQKKNMDILARAWLDGYEVEKEPKYTVKIKATKHYFAKDGNGRIYFSLKYESAFTKIELEKVNLGWVLDCPGIELEEVTD